MSKNQEFLNNSINSVNTGLTIGIVVLIIIIICMLASSESFKNIKDFFTNDSLKKLSELQNMAIPLFPRGPQNVPQYDYVPFQEYRHGIDPEIVRTMSPTMTPTTMPIMVPPQTPQDQQQETREEESKKIIEYAKQIIDEETKKIEGFGAPIKRI